VDFAPHSVTHRIFSRLATEEAETEIALSWRRLQEELCKPLPVFAWPTGRAADYSARDVALAGRMGLAAYVTAEDDYAELAGSGQRQAPLALKRFAFPGQVIDVLQYGSAIERLKQVARTHVAF
jgi:peptidoglycan/xylan/chitin deacetylase (PgdA/CDA1 family)